MDGRPTTVADLIPSFVIDPDDPLREALLLGGEGTRRPGGAGVLCQEGLAVLLRYLAKSLSVMCSGDTRR